MTWSGIGRVAPSRWLERFESSGASPIDRALRSRLLAHVVRSAASTQLGRYCVPSYRSSATWEQPWPPDPPRSRNRCAPGR